MAWKCQRKNLPLSAESALKQIRDAIGIRIITGFVDTYLHQIDFIRQMPSDYIFKEKDYINHSQICVLYHLILEVRPSPYDCYVSTLLRTSYDHLHGLWVA